VKPEAHADAEKVIEEAAVPPAEAAESATPEAEAEVVEAATDAETGSNKSETEKEQLNLEPGEEEDSSAPARVQPMESPVNLDGADLGLETIITEPMELAEEKAVVSALHPPPPPPRHPRPARPSAVDSNPQEKDINSSFKSDKPEEPGFAPDGTPYVGDTTWEERTWKELTRLREDAFWARAGRVQ